MTPRDTRLCLDLFSVITGGVGLLVFGEWGLPFREPQLGTLGEILLLCWKFGPLPCSVSRELVGITDPQASLWPAAPGPAPQCLPSPIDRGREKC